jgi:AcrR family transcriptional regulator
MKETAYMITASSCPQFDLAKAAKRLGVVTGRLTVGESTKYRIAFTLETLMADKPYDGITIMELAAASGISRHTFYNHFDSKDNLVVWMLAQIQEKANLLVDEPNPGWRSTRLAILSLFKSKPDFFGQLYSTDCIARYGEAASRVFVTYYSDLIEKRRGGLLSDLEQQQLLQYCVGAFMMLAVWVKSGYEQEPELLVDASESVMPAFMKKELGLTNG